MDDHPDVTVHEYKETLRQAHRALDAVLEKCLAGRKDDEKLTEADWTCITSIFDGMMQGKGKVPMVGGPC